MKHWLDCEFDEHDGVITLISIGLVDEDDRTFYAESSEVDWEKVDPWILENVRPHLLGNAIPRSQIKADLLEYIGTDIPEFWAYNDAYDWVCLCSLFGRQVDLPEDWPSRCRELKDEMERLGVTKDQLPQQADTAHHALADARWNREAGRFLDKLGRIFARGPLHWSMYKSWIAAREACKERDPQIRALIAREFQHASDKAKAIREGRRSPLSF